MFDFAVSIRMEADTAGQGSCSQLRVSGRRLGCPKKHCHGETVVLRVDGISDFEARHPRRHDEHEQVQLYSFDILAVGGEDLAKLPLTLRKNNLARLLDRRPGRPCVHLLRTA